MRYEFWARNDGAYMTVFSGMLDLTGAWCQIITLNSLRLWNRRQHKSRLFIWTLRIFLIVSTSPANFAIFAYIHLCHGILHIHRMRILYFLPTSLRPPPILAQFSILRFLPSLGMVFSLIKTLLTFLLVIGLSTYYTYFAINNMIQLQQVSVVFEGLYFRFFFLYRCHVIWLLLFVSHFWKNSLYIILKFKI